MVNQEPRLEILYFDAGYLAVCRHDADPPFASDIDRNCWLRRESDHCKEVAPAVVAQHQFRHIWEMWLDRQANALGLIYCGHMRVSPLFGPAVGNAVITLARTVPERLLVY